MIKRNWLWDAQANEKEAKQILRNEKDPRFFIYAGMLLSRNNDVDYVFSLIEKRVFCQNWPLIKERIEQEGWFSPYKLEFWQPVYEKILKELKVSGVKVHRFPDIPVNKHRFRLAMKLRDLRKEAGYTQEEAAALLGVKQKYVSKLETGRVNASIDALSRIANIYLKTIEIVFKGA